MITWNEEKCEGCCICTHFCPVDAVTSFGPIEIDPGMCTDCLECIVVCPTGALEEGE